MKTCPNATAHESAQEMEQWKIINTISFGINSPFLSTLTSWMHIVRCFDEEI